MTVNIDMDMFRRGVRESVRNWGCFKCRRVSSGQA
jgi:hypothetical protein